MSRVAMRGAWTLCLLAAMGNAPIAAADRPAGIVRIATFNSSLNRLVDGGLRHDLSTTDDPQAHWS